MSTNGINLLKHLDDHLDLNGIRELVFALRQSDPKLDFDNLGGPDTPKRQRLINLIRYHEHRNTFDQLVSTADRLIAVLAGRRKTGAPFQVPPLPAHFVPRPRITAELRDRLLSEAAPTSRLVVSAVHGLGGIGKSTLAAALVHDPQVQLRFPDGVVWVTLGQQPDLLPLLSGWIQALHDYDFKPTSVQSASAHLRTLLQDKAALLVVDDVWDPDDARPFLAGGSGCRILITTRRADVADAVGAQLYSLDVLTPSQSLDLFSARLGRPLEGSEREATSVLARAAGHLPQALELAAVRILRGETWVNLCTALTAEVARLEALEDPRNRRKGHATLEAAFNLSLYALRNEDEAAWQAFTWLGVLPEDALIVAPMAATLWGVSEAEAADLLDWFWNDSLLLPGVTVHIRNREWPAYRLHDLLHDHARRLLVSGASTEKPSSITNLPQAHAALLDRYRTRTQDDLWSTLPDDGYIHQRLTWHMEKAEQPDLIHALLREETPKGRNAWYEAQERLSQTAVFLTDVARAWQQAEEMALLKNGDSQSSGILNEANGKGVALQCRYALITASLSSLIENIPVELVVKLIANRIWFPTQAITYIRQHREPSRRASLLVTLSPHLSNSDLQQLLSENLNAIRLLKRDRFQIESLAVLIPLFDEEIRQTLVAEVFDTALALPECDELHLESPRIKALVMLMPHLSKQQREQAVREALHDAYSLPQTAKFSDYSPRAEALAELMPYLPDELRDRAVSQGLEYAQELSELDGHGRRSPRVELLTKIGPYITETNFSKTLALVRSLPEHDAYCLRSPRAEALKLLAPQTPSTHLPEVLTIASSLPAWDNHSANPQAETLGRFVTRLPEAERLEVLEKALAAIERLPGRDENNTSPQREELVALATYLTTGQLDKALTIVRRIRHRMTRAEALGTLAPYLSIAQLKTAFSIARGIKSPPARTAALASMAPLLPSPARKKAVVLALADIKETVNDYPQRFALAQFVPYMSSRQLGSALSFIRSISDIGNRIQTMAAIAIQLPAGERDIVLAEVWPVIRGLPKLAGYGVSARIEMGIALAPYLTSSQVFAIALSAVRTLPKHNHGYVSRITPSQVLAALAPHLTQADLIKLKAKIGMIKDDVARVEGFTAFLAYLPQSERQEVLAEGVYLAHSLPLRAMPSRYPRATILEALLPHLSLEQRTQILPIVSGAVQAIEWEPDRLHAVARLASYLPEEGRAKALAEALAIAQSHPECGENNFGKPRGHALALLAPYFAPTQLREAFTSAKAIEDDEARVEALLWLMPYLPRSLQEEALESVLIVAGKLPLKRPFGTISRPDALIMLLPYLDDQQRKGVVGEISILLERSQSDLDYIAYYHQMVDHLVALVPYLTETELIQFLWAAIADGFENTRIEALVILAPHLAALPPSRLYGLWRDALHALVTRSRPGFLNDLAALLPVLAALGGPDALLETFYAIQDVGRWWP